ncbi:MAG: phosphoglucosamine mutase [Kistimonas sp.]|nr:phosphoglucosamine mutase [Kistimonas sp.]
MTDRKHFGTDGIRGRVGNFPIVPDMMLRLGWAAGRAFGEQGSRRVLIGKDTRLSGYMLESALEAGLSAAGMDIWLLGPMPTPAVAYLTRTFQAGAGIVISASHNLYHDNGIKFFSAQGTKLSDETEAQIESLLDQEPQVVPSEQLGRARRVEDAAGRYIEYCKATVRPQPDLQGLHIVVDASHGAAYQVGPAVFVELGARVDAIGVSPDGMNINKDVGSTHLDTLRAAVRDKGAHLGIAFDGDGDRVLMIDDKGSTVDGDDLLCIIARHWKKQGELEGGVVGTVMSNLGLEKAMTEAGIPFVRTGVGDRHVNARLQELGWQLGGEASGHLICRRLSTTGDGIVAALQVLRVMVQTGLSLADLHAGMVKYPQRMINVRTTATSDWQSSAAVRDAVKQAEVMLTGRGRVLVRQSGTEPVVRVMIEGEDSGEVNQCCQALADVVATAMS